jgi:hypothetical protein
MARIQFEKIVDEINIDMKRVVEDVVKKVAPKVQVKRDVLYREFLKAVGQRISPWVVVNDRNVVKVCRHCGEK